MIYQDRKPIFILVPYWEQVHTARIKANNSYLPNGIGMHTVAGRPKSVTILGESSG